ncbi:ATP-binding protein [Kineococcus auxinigenes]|uniref:ATP-binding protein n=1 Tax=unclassified Kineococcus TaxID=2621656 RepID=UPI003D7E9555
MSLDPDAADEAHLKLAPDAGALAQARRFLSLYAQHSGLDAERADDLVQAAAELMAVGRRVHQVLTLAVHEHPDRLTVRVELAGPVNVDVTDEAVVLLNELSRQWGWHQLPGCTQVWCEVAKHAPTP